MKVSLSVDELAAIRNALATRHDDLVDLIAGWAEETDAGIADQRQDAEDELALIIDLAARLS